MTRAEIENRLAYGRVLPGKGYEVVHISPHIAQRLLDRKLWNRELNERNVLRLVAAIREGRWVCDGKNPIVLDPRGQLIDGQHRLTACIRAETPIKTALAWGLKRRPYRARPRWAFKDK